VRLGVDEPDESAVAKEEVSLVLRGFGRVRGEVGPVYLARDVDDHGDPFGYRRLTGAKLLFDVPRERVLASLQQRFTYKEAKRAYGKGDQATTNFLQRCIALGLMRRPKRGEYEKISPSVE